MQELHCWIATQIITESFPVSSSTHVRMLCAYTPSGHLDELLHVPTLLIYAIFFRNRWLPALLHLPRTWKIVVPLVLRVAISCAITVGFYLLFAYTRWNLLFPMGLGLIITTGLLFSLKIINPVSGKVPIILGLAQSLALLPGISRMAITYVTGRWLGMSAQHAFEYSCAIQVPLIMAAAVRGAPEVKLLNPGAWLVILVATVIAYGGLCITWYLAQRNKFHWFGWYVLGVVLWLEVVRRIVAN